MPISYKYISELRKRTGNTIRRNLFHSYEPLETDDIGFNINKRRNWERTRFEGKPVIYHHDEHRSYQHERYGWGLKVETGQFVRMGPYRRWDKDNGVISACLIGVTNYHYLHRDKTHNPEFWHARQHQKQRRNDKNSQKHETRCQIRQTLQDGT
jgi:hypothetical protein